jgi:ribosome-associated protein
MRKASDISAMRVTACTSLTNFVIIITGTSRPQNQAIANAIGKDVEVYHAGLRCLGNGIPEGSADSGWILLDYGDVMVHVMTPKSRLFYDMEGVWRKRGGESLDLSSVLVVEDGGSSNSSSSRTLSSDSSGGDDDDDDDFAFNGEDDYDDDDDDKEDEEAYDDEVEGIQKTSMRKRLDVEKEIDPFWS